MQESKFLIVQQNSQEAIFSPYHDEPAIFQEEFQEKPLSAKLKQQAATSRKKH